MIGNTKRVAVVALLLTTTSLPSLVQSTKLRSRGSARWDDNRIAVDMNEYKLYNLDRFESKKSGSFSDALHDKKALKEAEDMWEDDDGNTRREDRKSKEEEGGEAAEQQRAQQISGAERVQVLQQTTAGQKSEEQTVMTEEEINDSKNAVSNSVGEKQIRIDLQPNADSLFMATFFIGTPGKPVRVILDTGSEHLAVASDLCENCPTKPYSLAQSKTNQLLSNDTSSVVYGSAKFEGKQTQDKTCMLKEKGCMDFKFLSLSKGEGLDQGSDGILGLSPEMSTDRSDQHLVWSLMKAGLIDRASFSLSLSDQSSFAVFGGIDEEQIVGGATGLKPFRNNPDIFSHIKAWALTGEALYYGLPQIGQTGSYPAVIDTGSTLIAVPSALFQGLQAQWRKAVPDLDCSTDANFCETTKQSCSQIEHSLQPVGFLIGGGKSSSGSQTVFEILPSEYLFQVDGAGAKCQFAIAENKLDKFNNKNFIFGQLFLKHFYTVYNYENEQIALGINKNSEKLVRMVNPSQREQVPALADEPVPEPKASQAQESEAQATEEKQPAPPSPPSPSPPSPPAEPEKPQEKAAEAPAPPAPTAPSAKLQLDVDEQQEAAKKRSAEDFETRVSEVEDAIID